MEKQLVIFKLANEHYGVDIASVESIIKTQPIACVPHAPDFVEGVTNLRGSVLTVIDLRKRFGLKKQAISQDSRIVVVAIGNVKIGMIVDSVSEVLRIPQDAIEPPPPMVTTIESMFITGIAKIESRLVIMLDLQKILTLEEQGELEVLAAA